MRAERWWQDTSIVDVLVEQPNAFEFIQATRLLRHAEAPHAQKEGDWAKQFKFHSSLNLNFPNADRGVELSDLTRIRVPLSMWSQT